MRAEFWRRVKLAHFENLVNRSIWPDGRSRWEKTGRQHRPGTGFISEPAAILRRQTILILPPASGKITFVVRRYCLFPWDMADLHFVEPVSSMPSAAVLAMFSSRYHLHLRFVNEWRQFNISGQMKESAYPRWISGFSFTVKRQLSLDNYEVASCWHSHWPEEGPLWFRQRISSKRIHGNTTKYPLRTDGSSP